MKRYWGHRTGKGCVVTVEYENGNVGPLNPRFDLWNHSPDGFEWGYHGSGPAQLALALLASALQDRRRALRLYQDFKRKVVANLPRSVWALTQEFIRETCDLLDGAQAQAGEDGAEAGGVS